MAVTHKLVPVEPDKNMRKAGRGPWATNDPEAAAVATFKAMCAAAPDSELAKLEREFAVEWAVELLLFSSTSMGGEWRKKTPGCTNFDKAAHYLDLIGRLERHQKHPEWVRIKEQP